MITSEILPGVWHCRQDLTPVFPGEWSAINVIVGERIAIVDSGMPGGESLVWQVLESIGRRPTDIAAIVNTHFHGDHTGSNGPLRERSGAQIMIHALDSSLLGSGQLEGPTAGPADVQLDDGSRVDLGDRELRIMHLPGHTPGSIGVLLASEGALFTGDSLQARGTGVQFIASYADPPAYVRSVRKAMHLDLQHLVPAHAFAPFSDSHVQGSDVQRFLDISLEHAFELDSLITHLVRTGTDPTPASTAARVCERFGHDHPSRMAIATVQAHLKRPLAVR